MAIRPLTLSPREAPSTGSQGGGFIEGDNLPLGGAGDDGGLFGDGRYERQNRLRGVVN